MALIVEDGSIVAGANSYISLADARAFLSQFGQVLAAVDAEAEAQLIAAFYFVNSYETKFQGERISRAQTGSFPRSGVYINGFEIMADEVPAEVAQAQCFAAFEESVKQGTLAANNAGKSTVLKEVVGAVKVQYSDSGAIDGVVYFTRVMNSLTALFKTSANAFSVPIFRG